MRTYLAKVPVPKLGIWYFVDDEGVIYSAPMLTDGSADEECDLSIIGPYFDDGVSLTFLDESEAMGTWKRSGK